MIKKLLNRKFVWGFVIATTIFQIAVCVYQPERIIPFFCGVCSGISCTLMFVKGGEDKDDKSGTY